MKKIKILISVILLLAVTTTSFSVFAATYTWTSSPVHQVAARYGSGMPFHPEDGYVSKQNPPDFTWSYVNGATFNLKICSQKSMADTSIVYYAENIRHNYYNFPHTFEVGKDYYWSVQYVVGSSKSAWSTAKKFRIEPDAYEFTVEPIEHIMSRISPTHPRIYTSDNSYSRYSVEEFRALKDRYSYAKNDYDTYIYNANRYLAEAKVYTEPATPDTDGIANPTNSHVDSAVTAICITESRGACTRMTTAAMAYLLSGDEKYGNYAKNILLELAGWRYDSYSATGFRRQDQLFREVMYQSAIVYDWIYPLLTPAERTKVLTMIKNRMGVVEYLIESIRKNPHDSHGWTTIGFMAITAYATIDEIDISRSWLENIIPLYTAAMHPWSHQDGGWAQGLAYWSYSSGFSKEFINILALAGMIDLYDKAWSQKEYLWNLYAWGPYTYGSYGDGSAGYPTTSDALHAQKDMAYFTGNPVAKWIWETNNSGKTSGLEYFAAGLEDIRTEAPTDYTLSHIFDDIGWVVMTNDLMNRDKVQLTFKSSPYGSYNHSHGDQNSFFVQAYGKELAIKSGYYDSYHTAHDKYFTRQSFAHNTTTIDGGKGQPIDRFDATGKVTQFVYQMEMDSVTADSTEAYFAEGNESSKFFDKNERTIVYLRPGVFVVIDTLDAKGTKSSTYEWWLNGIDIENNGNTATITNGSVKLDAKVMFPEKITSQKYEGFVTPSGETYLPNGYSSNTKIHNRISFTTPYRTKTKMVVVMDVYDEENAETVNIEPVATISADKKYMVLEFDDSNTRMIVKLTDDEDPITYGNIEFVGDAVTVTDNSIMLTNGYYLMYGGKTLVDANSQKVTVALGCDQMSISSEKDTSIQIGTHSPYWKSTDIDSLTDEKFRNVTENNLGIRLAEEEGIIFAEIENGSYTLLKNVDSAINTYQIAPENISVIKDAQGNAKVYWDSLRYVGYDISINDKVTEDVTSGYQLPASEETLKIMVRSKLSMEKSDWSSPIYYSGKLGDYVSYVKYRETDNGITATRYGRFGENVNFLTAAHGNELLSDDPAIDSKSEGIFENTVGKTSKVYSYMWTNSLTPKGNQSTYKSNNTSLLGIYVDGRLIEGFESSKDSYFVDLESRDKISYPVISAKAADASAKVSITNADSTNNKSVITITAGDGTKREVTINIIPKRDLHKVKGASLEEDFVKDSGRENASSGVSKTNVGTISYIDASDNLVVKNLKLHTNFNDREDGYFGARVSADRPPNSVNHMEMYYVDEELKGYDYFVFENDTVYKNDKGKQTYTVEFEIDDDAEVVVIGKNFSGLIDDGFEEEERLWAKGRYMHVVGNEDVFYNIAYRGKSLKDCDYNSGQKKYYMKNYDVMLDWVNVDPPAGCESWSYEQYLNNSQSLSKDRFAVISNDLTGYYVDWSTMFTSAYSKQFKVDEPTKVSFDLTNLNQSVRAVVLVRPIPTKDAVSDFKFVAPKAFVEIPAKLRRGYTYSNDEDSHAAVECYEDFSILSGFGNGAKAYVNSSLEVYDFNDLCEIENAWYIPPYKFSGEGDGWLYGYYHGDGDITDACGSYSIPCIKGKTFDWYSFDLNCPANVYVAYTGTKPAFIDDSWTKINVGSKVFSADGKDYAELYVKYVDVKDETSATVTMPTKNSSGGTYYTFIKPIK